MAEMSIKKKRPKNLDLTTIKLPWSGKVSILHRISGAGLFLMLPLIIWLFGASFTAPETFAACAPLANASSSSWLDLGVYAPLLRRYPLFAD